MDAAQREALFTQGAPIDHVYFPETAVVSLLITLQKGGNLEVATVGSEGFVGLPAFLSDDTASMIAIAQIPGSLARMPTKVFRDLSASGALHALLLRYTQALITQIAQTAVCNANHLVEQRCARWLLMTHDRVGESQFPLTHEFLAYMLGVRRSGVTVTMRSLADRKLVSYTRGRLRILDREGLEAISCECYRSVREHFDRLLPKVD